jgi:hypothetical protein
MDCVIWFHTLPDSDFGLFKDILAKNTYLMGPAFLVPAANIAESARVGVLAASTNWLTLVYRGTRARAQQKWAK